MSKTKTRGVYLQSDARWSKAYMVLTRTSRDLLRLFMELRKMPKGKCVNNGKIKLTRKTAMKKLGKSKGAIEDSFAQVIEVGFIKINIEGEGTEGHRYTILIGSKGEDDSKARWRNYPEKNYRPKKVKTEIGKETRWKKGEKVNNHPTKVYHGGDFAV
jgi:hypothetical protein